MSSIIDRVVRRVSTLRLLAVVVALTVGGSLSLTPSVSLAASRSTSTQWNPLALDRAGQSNVNYVLWSHSCGHSRCFRLEQIDMANDTSTFVSAPPLSNLPRVWMGGLVQLDFANALDGYELLNPGGQRSDQLYATFDGGRHWHHDDFIAGETIERIASTPSMIYVVGGVKCATTNELCQRWQLNSSPAAASHWTRVSRPYAYGHDSIYPAVTAYANSVWVTTQEQSKPYLTLMASSSNGGKTFAVRSVSNLPSLLGCALTATSSTSIWAQCDDGNMAGDVEYSNDGGTAWRNLASVTFGEFFWGAFDAVTNDVAFFENGAHSHQLGELIGGATKVIIAGTTPYTQLSALSFTSPTRGLALSSSIGPSSRYVLYETTDGGDHWKRLFA